MAQETNVRRVLFARTDRLGETLLNLPAAAALKAALPGAALTLLVHPDLQPLLAALPWVDETISAPQGPRHAWWKRALQLGRRLRTGRFDAAIVSNPKQELHVGVWLAGIPQRIGYDRKCGWLLTRRLPDAKGRGGRHEVEYNLDLVRALGIAAEQPRWQFPELGRERADVRALLAVHGVSGARAVVVVHPWTSDPAKQWPLDRFRRLVERVSAQPSTSVVMIGGVQERPRASALLPAGGAIADLTGRLTLTQLAALLREARLLVSSDSGPVHLAAAVGTPTVTLFGTTDAARGPQRWGPWGQGHIIIWKPSMGAITVNEVLAAVQRQLEGDGTG